MTARNYDVILNFATSPNEVGIFEAGNVIVGNTSGTVGIVANVDLASNTLKVKYSNNFMEFSVTENVHANVSTSRIINVDFQYSNANATGAVVNEVNYAALNAKLEESRFAIRTAGNTFVTNATNAFILPIPANTKEEITVILNNAIVHPDEYIWTGELATTVEQPASFGGNVQLNSQTVFNVTPINV